MWWYIAAFVAALVITYALTPKPQQPSPAGLKEVRAPTAEEGRELPVVFGTREVDGPNVVWYGDIRLVPIKAKGGKK